MVLDIVRNCCDKFDSIESVSDTEILYNDPEFLNFLIQGLIGSGIGIAMVGNSRPTSGAEHHVAHFLELKAVRNEIPHHFHGVNVALGTLLMAMLYYDIFSEGFSSFRTTSFGE